MSRHPCLTHRPGHHDDACMSGPCGICGTDLQTTASGECRSCLLIVCEQCDAGYDPDQGPICAPCAPPGNGNGNGSGPDVPPPDGWQLHRMCVFLLSLTCGYLVSLFANGWYPVSVACCDRLGGTIQRGRYIPYASGVDYVQVQSERYEHRPPGTPPEPTEVRGRWPRTDDPYRSPYPGGGSSARR
ncbi:hypothetical protein [Catellatospora citrea]|uniref:Uncharacterized protein n=1 Tax=Catellatospora citrea TaxID=53366 RepID=A0A8J3KJK3_9ACTN|nr:hypothetical protein [Catellatospora citrea]RKE07914.1 hypothetical protein C8E86_2753 [Catellatospora citrea]GIG02075.1 hypothetical protein Cci01nite_71680 [Catellatospora citrea]